MFSDFHVIFLMCQGQIFQMKKCHICSVYSKNDFHFQLNLQCKFHNLWQLSNVFPLSSQLLLSKEPVNNFSLFPVNFVTFLSTFSNSRKMSTFQVALSSNTTLLKSHSTVRLIYSELNLPFLLTKFQSRCSSKRKLTETMILFWFLALVSVGFPRCSLWRH